ncbi:MAG: DNA-formamidopyrimidine glycosylase [Acidobacteria bacterium RIFCSPLOWO2_12_FULL_54_10]|nr:MAG: DNA-formamidopyrimidine glycosylase [Acidobacteria bacterium RIFCSPLOWO2_12_FULL_54_10]
MPELPEVETVVRTLKPTLLGRTILKAEFCGALANGRKRSGRLLRDAPNKVAAKLHGAKIEDVVRYGKHIVIRLKSGGKEASPFSFAVHLGMTGKLTFEDTASPRNRHTHMILDLDQAGRWLHYNDIRRFGQLQLLTDSQTDSLSLGPDPLEISFQDFLDRLGRRKTMMKSLLLDQKFLRGIGNIYADESLFRARLHPRTLASSIKQQQARALYNALRNTLREAIAKCGTSISDYVDGWGKRGSFQANLHVYQRTGEPCLSCGTKIRRIIVAGRGTHFCPRCQQDKGLAKNANERNSR